MKAHLFLKLLLIILWHNLKQGGVICQAQQQNDHILVSPTINNEFAWKLFRNSKPSNRNSENFILCPASVQLILSVLQLASEGNTREQLKVIANNAVPAQLYYILNPKSAEIKSASGIFIDSDEKINKNISLHIYLNGGDIFSLPLQKQSAVARNAINRWASNATNGHIPQLLNEGDDISNVKAILASAVYFHNSWKYKLTASQSRTFYTYFNQGTLTPYMEVKNYFQIKSIDLGRNIVGKMINLPYKDDHYSMLIIVPGSGITLNKFFNNLDHNVFTRLISTINETHFSEVHFFMPKFRITSKASLVAPLKKMGLEDIFSSKARLTKLLEDRSSLRISEIWQQSTLEVDEYGTIATSVTTSYVVPLSAADPEPITFIVDKPFVAIIIEIASQTPIFIAKITSPSENRIIEEQICTDC